MVALNKAFDFSAVDTTDDFAPIPAGEYVVEAVDSSLKETNAKDGDYFAFQFRVCEGQYENRRIFVNITNTSPKPDNQTIGEKQLAQLCSAVGLNKPLEDTSELHGVPVIARVGIRPAKGEWPARNNINAYKPVSNAPHVVAAKAAEPAKPAAPWKR